MSYDDDDKGPSDEALEWAIVILCVGTIIYVVGGLLGAW